MPELDRDCGPDDEAMTWDADAGYPLEIEYEDEGEED